MSKISYNFGADAPITLARSASFGPYATICEGVDNSREADAHTINVSILEPNLPELMVSDDGKGMDEEGIKDFFTFLTTKTKKAGPHTHVGKEAYLSLMRKGGVIKIVTHKKDSLPIFVTWDGESEPEMTILMENDVPIGTTISITKIHKIGISIAYIKGCLSARYFRQLSDKDNPITIKVNGSELQASDPLYWDYISSEGSFIDSKGEIHSDTRYEETFTVTDDDDEKHEVCLRIRDFSACAEEMETILSEYDKYSESQSECAYPGFEDEKRPNPLTCRDNSGFYLNLCGYEVLLGEGTVSPYISRRWHEAMCGIRVELSIGEKLARKLDYSFNKTKGIPTFDKYQMFADLMSCMKVILEHFIQHKTSAKIHAEKAKTLGYSCEVPLETTGRKLIGTVDANESNIRSVFATKEGNQLTYNANSGIAKRVKKNEDIVILWDTASQIYAAFSSASDSVNKKQYSVNADLTLAENIKRAKEQILQDMAYEFMQGFCSIGNGIPK